MINLPADLRRGFPIVTTQGLEVPGFPLPLEALGETFRALSANPRPDHSAGSAITNIQASSKSNPAIFSYLLRLQERKKRVCSPTRPDRQTSRNKNHSTAKQIRRKTRPLQFFRGFFFHFEFQYGVQRVFTKTLLVPPNHHPLM